MKTKGKNGIDPFPRYVIEEAVRAYGRLESAREIVSSPPPENAARPVSIELEPGLIHAGLRQAFEQMCKGEEITLTVNVTLPLSEEDLLSCIEECLGEQESSSLVTSLPAFQLGSLIQDS
ncbi:MAG: FKBP-type peptidyl-prolyl cis-trans isomerase [Cyanobacteria bacterium P01_D01_bin.73]